MRKQIEFERKNIPNEFWTGYKMHDSKRCCFYCIGERATIKIGKTVYPPLGADGSTVVINNTLHL